MYIDNSNPIEVRTNGARTLEECIRLLNNNLKPDPKTQAMLKEAEERLGMKYWPDYTAESKLQ